MKGYVFTMALNRSGRPRLLDLFCGAGGAAMGYHRAGFEVIGVDIVNQPRYPFEFVQGDALRFLEDMAAHSLWPRIQFGRLDAVHASPPCQFATKARKLQGNDHPDLLTPTRKLLKATGLPWIIENVPGAPMRVDVMLNGGVFGLQTYRERWFETSFPIDWQLVPPPSGKQAKMGRPPKDGELIQVVGHFSDAPLARKAMGIDWMTARELSQAIPPAYTEWIGRQLLAAVEVAA